MNPPPERSRSSRKNFICLHEIATELGLQRQPDDASWSDEDAQRIIDAVDKRFRKVISDRFLS
ncbi:hypothetical protein [Mesorhizobium sp.]|uniref:hypothetical protein n=1 Tax=Mesorhizobium sp. TaxID=1871066 RepID=UPI000FE784B5|nr:hypothetical protein [Mesorhizobium sp.]RWO55387.1 MAG: hypothetical protein EOS14_30080 [Mesorhizobium sp.]